MAKSFYIFFGCLFFLVISTIVFVMVHDNLDANFGTPNEYHRQYPRLIPYLGLVQVICVVGFVATRLLADVNLNKRLLKTGLQREATILEAINTYSTTQVGYSYYDKGTYISTQRTKINFILELTDDVGTLYKVKTSYLLNQHDIGILRTGQKVKVRVSKRNRRKVYIEDFGLGFQTGYSWRTKSDNSVLPKDNASPFGANPTFSSFENFDVSSFNNVQQKGGMDVFQEMQQREAFTQHILKNGISAKATVLSYTDLNTRINGNNPYVSLSLRVFPERGDAYTAEARNVIHESSVPKFQPGATITVKYLANDLSKVCVEHS